MKIIAAEISAGMFHWDVENNTFSQEASSLGESVNPMSQVWEDACDQGFKLVSVKNPELYVLFVFTGHDYHHEEMCGWNFEAFEDNNTAKMGMQGTKVLIIND